MDSDRRRGFKLVDLMVVILVTAILLAVFVRSVNRRDGCGRRTQCQNNMRQLALALMNFSSSKNHFPNAGTIFDDPSEHGGDPYKSNLRRAILDPASLSKIQSPLLYNWVVEILPYLDQQDLANAWDRQQSYVSNVSAMEGLPPNALVGSTSISVLLCPNDTTAQPGQANLSYVVNGGFARWPAIPVGWTGGAADGEPANGGSLQWAPPGSGWQETQAVVRKLGVMFLGTQSGEEPWDIKSVPGAIVDGTSNTFLIAENTLAGASSGTAYSGGIPTNWACPLPNFAMFIASDDICQTDRSSTDCLGGQLRPRSKGDDGRGWARANARGTYENINYSQKLTIEGSSPFASSGHDGGANFAFCDGSIRYLSDRIDGTIYAKLITPAGSQLPEAIRQRPLPQGAVDRW